MRMLSCEATFCEAAWMQTCSSLVHDVGINLFFTVHVETGTHAYEGLGYMLKSTHTLKFIESVTHGTECKH